MPSPNEIHDYAIAEYTPEDTTGSAKQLDAMQGQAADEVYDDFEEEARAVARATRKHEARVARRNARIKQVVDFMLGRQ